MNTAKTFPRLAVAALTFALPVSFTLLLSLTLLLALSGCSNSSAKAGGPGGRGRPGEGGPVPVVVAMVSQRDVPINVDVIGNVEAYSTITVKAQVGGELTKVSFHEGDFVKKGDLLFTIDARPFEAQLSQAQANLARDTAALSQAQANLARDIANEKYAQDQADQISRIVRSRRGLARTDGPDAVQRRCAFANRAGRQSRHRERPRADRGVQGGRGYRHRADELHHHHFAH